MKIININNSINRNDMVKYNINLNNLNEVQNDPVNVVSNYDELLYKCWDSGKEADVKECINYLFKVSTPSFKISVGTMENLIKSQFNVIKTEKENDVKFVNSFYEDPVKVDENTVKVNVKDSFSDGDKIIEYTLIKDDNKWYINNILLNKEQN
ncbi:DUF4878 domain-containing protein [Clostridium sp. JN-9]|uniref:DUF4878 domain-containing protein n=1 Tax=Clostridium sp. JN-9 TaxID=2507159 RepID=UPI000FFE2380|nr:DUF4878 domain-containing protein [Clostridium sp. JN-9]QAT40321.1 hypothetical protein EQM05_08640 [Clostridium sp. JN-9]